LLLGLWGQPKDNLRLSYDQELMYADATFTRISPRQFQHYLFRGEYRPAHGVSMNGSLNIYEARNNVFQINHLEHTRNYGYTLNYAPADRWSLDIGYNYTGVFSQTNICYTLGFGPPPPGAAPCPIVGTALPIQALSFYNSHVNYGFVDIVLKPMKRVTLKTGYSIDAVTGNTLILNPNSTPGPLNFNYHRPYGILDIEVAKGLTGRAGYGFYDYNEKDAGDITGPRSFRGNLVNLTMIYSF